LTSSCFSASSRKYQHFAGHDPEILYGQMYELSHKRGNTKLGTSPSPFSRDARNLFTVSCLNQWLVLGITPHAGVGAETGR
jgi:hypothetical protein